MWRPRTQKAQGLLSLLRGPSLVCEGPGHFNIVPQPPEWAMGTENAQALCAPVPFPCFGRPCPVAPKHGFVESVALKTPIHALNLLALTLRGDPNGEMILMPQFTGEQSAVANNAGVVWGLGHDGVTGAGKGPTFFVPALADKESWQTCVKRSLEGYPSEKALAKDECHYIELVEHNGAMRAVQLRTGPVQEAQAEADYIPRKMEVKEVLKLSDCGNNLIRWDKMIRTARAGTVVMMPGGTTRFSHYAVHCLLNHVPMVFGRRVDVGETLTPSEASPLKPMNRYDYAYLAQLILTQLLEPRVISDGSGNPGDTKAFSRSNPDKWRVTTAIGTCHAMAGWSNERHLLRLRAYGIVACFAYAAAASIGELRHFYRNGPGCLNNALPAQAKHTTDMKEVLSTTAYNAFIHREDISRGGAYKSMSVLPISAQIRLLTSVARDFRTPGWGSSFGGHRWAETASQAAWLGRALLSFVEHPERRRWERLQSRFNATLHCCHTHGKTLTKWVPSPLLDLGSKAPGLCFLNSYTAQCIFDDPHLGELDALRKQLSKKGKANG